MDSEKIRTRNPRTGPLQHYHAGILACYIFRFPMKYCTEKRRITNLEIYPGIILLQNASIHYTKVNDIVSSLPLQGTFEISNFLVKCDTKFNGFEERLTPLLTSNNIRPDICIYTSSIRPRQKYHTFQLYFRVRNVIIIIHKKAFY